MKTTCPDWRALCQQHEADLGNDTPEWLSALSHLDQCPTCQADAPAFDPTLMFRRLPALEMGNDGVEAMKQAVAGMRRGQTIVGVARARRRGPFTRPWLQAAALAAVLLGSLMLQGADGGPAPEMAAPAASTAAEAVANEIDLWRMPLIETTDPTYGSIIQVVDDDISVILVELSEVDV